jgi:hypothetical protein
VIDTTGTFDVLRLHEAIFTRVKSKILTERARQIGDLQPEMSPPPPPTEDAEKTAEKALERVKILRVFDFVGVVEAVDELSDALRVDSKEASGESKGIEEVSPPKLVELAKPRTEVADSDEDDEDMLFESPPAAVEEETLANPPSSLPSQTLEKIGMIIIDNISQVVNPILKTNYVRGKYCFIRWSGCKVNNIRSIPPNNFPSLTQDSHQYSRHSHGFAQLRFCSKVRFQHLSDECSTKHMDPGADRHSAIVL